MSDIGADDCIGALFADLPVQVQRISDEVGRGVVAQRALREGDTVCVDVPVAFVQAMENRTAAVVCCFCYRFLHGAREQAEVLAGVRARDDPTHPQWLLPGPDAQTRSAPGLTSCACGQLYCSRECLERDNARAHRILCVSGVPDEGHPLYQFKVHAIQNNEVFLGVGEVVAAAVQRFMTGEGVTFEQAMLPLLALHSVPWWDIAMPRGKLVPPARLRAQAQDSCALLQRLLLDHGAPGALVEQVTVELVGRLAGAFELNGMGVRVPSHTQLVLRWAAEQGEDAQLAVAEALQPLAAQIHATLAEEGGACEDEECEDEGCQDDEDEGGDEDDAEEDDEDEGGDEDDADSGAGAEESKLDGEGDAATWSFEELQQHSDALFPPLDGVALFPRLSMLNHSCAPNAAVLYLPSLPPAADGHAGYDGIRAQLRCLRDVAPGEQLTIAYVDAALPVRQRRQMLLQYGFVCSCPRCVEEEGGGGVGGGDLATQESAL